MQVGRRSRIVAKRAESASLPSYESLRRSQDFRRVLSDGTRHQEGGVVVVRASGLTGPPRLGLIVSRSCGSAVRRNRIKRRLRSAAGTVELKPGTDYVIIATSQLADARFERITSWLTRAIEETSDA